MLFIDGGDVLIILELPADKFIHFHDTTFTPQVPFFNLSVSGTTT